MKIFKKMGSVTDFTYEKADVVADLGLHYAPSNLGKRNQPTKVGNYRPGKWTMAVGFLEFANGGILCKG